MNKDVGRGSQVWRNDRRHLLHPFAEFPQFNTTGSRIFTKADGVVVESDDGRKFIDGIGGLWCVNIGYGRQEMAEAIAEQASALPYYNTFTDMTSPPAANLAAKLAELAPGDINHVFFTCSGSAANDTAVRLAQYYFNRQGRPSKNKIVARENAYHGSTYLAASLTGIRPNHDGFHTLLEGPDPLIHHTSEPNMYRRPDGMNEEDYCDLLIRDLEKTISEVGADAIACFIAEPIIGAGGVKVAPKGYHGRAKEVCAQNDVLYVSDEVVTSFGRLGHFFASEAVFNVLPDIITTAKGISSGYIPLGATLFSDEIFEVLSSPEIGGKPFSHGFTYSGHPVACAAGLKNIEIIESERLCEHVRSAGPYFEKRLGELRDLPIVGDTRGSHFMLAIEMVSDKKAKTCFESSVAVGKRIADHAYQQGVIARNVGDYIILSPPLTMSTAEIDEIVDVLKNSIEMTMDDFAREGIWQA